MIDYDLDEVYLSVEISVPLGLIINELLSNALKYAFAGFDTGQFSENRILLSFKNLSPNK